MWLLLVATGAAGLFSGAAIYINAVEHPARISCGTELALRQFAPSYRRATLMQASLAVTGSIAGLGSAWQHGDAWTAFAAVSLAAVIPFTLLVIFPTNAQLLDPNLDARGQGAADLLSRWGRLHAVRTVLSTLAFAIFSLRLGLGPAAP